MQVSATTVLLDAHWWIGPNELAWVDMSHRLWSATLTPKDGGIDVSLPKPMFDGKPVDTEIGMLDYDIARERFLISVVTNRATTRDWSS